LFVALLGEVSRWGLATEDIAALVPHADRALEWIRDYGDRDGDGFVEYERLNDQGLSTRAGRTPGTGSISPTGA
jgi:glycogen debranching enzyme